MKNTATFFTLLFLLFSFINNSLSQTTCLPGTVMGQFKISDTQGDFTGILDDGDEFSRCQYIGDLNNDGIPELAVGAHRDDDGGTDRGAVWILFFNQEGEVQSHQKISDIEGNFTGVLDNDDHFGYFISPIGDLNNDGIIDIVVGAWGDDDGGFNCGAVWILFLNSNGTVNSHQKISATQGGLVGLTANRVFGSSVSAIGDLNNDGVTDIAVGSPNYDNTGGLYRGCVWILFLNSNGTVNSQQLINDTYGNFNVILNDNDRFGKCIDSLGDLNGDGVNDIVVSSKFDDGGGSDIGAIYILFMNTDGTVLSHQKINDIEGGFTGILDDDDSFGYSVAGIDDVNGDGIIDLAVGAVDDDDGGTNYGAVWILFLDTNGTVKGHQNITTIEGGFTGTLNIDDSFGNALSSMGDIDGDGNIELAVGGWLDDDGGLNRGAVYVLDICINDLCISNFSYSNIINTTTVSFADSSDANIASWLWEFGDGDTSNLQNPEHSYIDYGSYEVCLTITTINGYTCSQCDTISLTLSNNEIAALNNTVVIYPNPVSEKLNIEIKSENNTYINIKVFSVTGELLKAVNVSGKSKNRTLSIETQTLPQGMYILQVEQDKSIVYKKFINR